MTDNTNLRQYSLSQIDQYNVGNMRFPNEPKYQTLLDFIELHYAHRTPRDHRHDRNQHHKGGHHSYGRGGQGDYRRNSGIGRDSFGNKKSQVVTSIFGKAETLDDQLKCKINELNSKITEDNASEILSEFKMLKFGEVQDIIIMSNVLHRSLLVCCKYGDQILELFDYLIAENPRYRDPLKTQFMSFIENQFKVLSSLDENSDQNIEARYCIKVKMANNYQLMIKCMKQRLIFDHSLIEETEKYLLGLNDVEGVELLIRFYVCLKEHEISLQWTKVVKSLEGLIKTKKYPRRLEFLLMDLE